MKARLNAFDKHTSGSFSETVEAANPAELAKALFAFEKKVPFGRFYYDNEILELSEAEKQHELFYREIIE